MTAILPTYSRSDMIRPPVNRLMKVLDRSFFKKSIPLSAARVMDNRKISRVRKELKGDLLDRVHLDPIRSINQTKALLLKPEVKAGGRFFTCNL